MSVRADEDWLEDYRKEHPDRVHDGHSTAQTGAGGGPRGSQGQGTKRGTRTHTAACTHAHIRVPALPPTLNEHIRMHWSEIRKKKRAWATLIQSQHREGLYVPAHMHYHMARPGVLDIDNKWGSSKIVIDACVKAGLLPDDDPQCIAGLDVTQEKVTGGDHYIEIELRTLDTAKPHRAEPDGA